MVTVTSTEKGSKVECSSTLLKGTDLDAALSLFAEAANEKNFIGSSNDICVDFTNHAPSVSMQLVRSDAVLGKIDTSPVVLNDAGYDVANKVKVASKKAAAPGISMTMAPKPF
jgi:hypothetical protein